MKALARSARAFSESFERLVEAAEETGNPSLAMMLERHSDYVENLLAKSDWLASECENLINSGKAVWIESTIKRAANEESIKEKIGALNRTSSVKGS